MNTKEHRQQVGADTFALSSIPEVTYIWILRKSLSRILLLYWRRQSWKTGTDNCWWKQWQPSWACLWTCRPMERNWWLRRTL